MKNKLVNNIVPVIAILSTLLGACVLKEPVLLILGLGFVFLWGSLTDEFIL